MCIYEDCDIVYTEADCSKCPSTNMCEAKDSDVRSSVMNLIKQCVDYAIEIEEKNK